MGEACEVTCEIRHGRELTFEQVEEAERELRERIEEKLAALGPEYVDFRTSTDDFVFVTSLRGACVEDMRGLCWDLASLVDQEASGRLVCVEVGFGPVRIWRFSASGVDESQVLNEG